MTTTLTIDPWADDNSPDSQTEEPSSTPYENSQQKKKEAKVITGGDWARGETVRH